MAKKKSRKKMKAKATHTECISLTVGIKDAEIAARTARRLAHKRGGAGLKVAAKSLRKDVARMRKARARLGCRRGR